MLKIMVSKWDENKDKLRDALSKRRDLDELNYIDFVKLTFDVIYNPDHPEYSSTKLDTGKIHEIDDGGYQGTLLFVIPFDSYQPNEYEYLITYVGYGSCSGCDTLQAIQGYGADYPSESQLNAYMALCKDILTNTIKPYNNGWKCYEDFEQIEVNEE